MIFMLTTTYPGHKEEEVNAIFFKQVGKDLPKHVKKWMTFATAAGSEGIKGYHIIYVERGKGDEGLIEIGKQMAPYGKIEGFQTKLEPLMGVTDMAKMIGR